MNEKNLKSRPPVVAVLGHVDHGKTSLLDYLRKSTVASREAGGITQSIGASTITLNSTSQITFLDTPGHAAFSQMRSRGSRVADIAVLVVAADDGVKPQTKEAIAFIKEANIPFLVALTKIDLPSASVESALASLEKEGVFFEGRGGDTPIVQVSSKTGKGIEELLEVLTLLAEMNNIVSDKDAPLKAVVIETSKDKRGQLATVVVKDGKLAVGQKINSAGIGCKVRGLFDNTGSSVVEILPGFAGQVLGFDTLPPVGSEVGDQKDIILTEEARKIVTPPSVALGEIAIYVKTKTEGSREALLAALPTGAIVMGSGVGDVNESDVAFSKSTGAAIFVFEAKVPLNVAKLAETDSVRIESFDIIYKLIERLEELLKKDDKQIIGKIQILASFPYEKKKVAGCKMVFGTIKKSDKLELMRGETILGNVKITSMKKQKIDITEAKLGEELGIIFEPQLAFAAGDMLVSTSTK